MDLLRQAGFDVSDWASSLRGERGAAMNPKYCYEWAFAEEGRAVALNLWHSELKHEPGSVRCVANYRRDAEQNRNMGRNAWVGRALRVDGAIRLAYEQGLPVHVILNDGLRRRQGDPTAQTSKVTARELDPIVWRVAEYDPVNGECILMRGAPVGPYVDQFSAHGEADVVVTRDRTGREYVRKRDVRMAALARAGGRCEFCGVEGFAVAGGQRFLETHHIMPLSEDGRDHVDNVIALCPNHHREAHYGIGRDAMRGKFRIAVRLKT